MNVYKKYMTLFKQILFPLHVPSHFLLVGEIQSLSRIWTNRFQRSLFLRITTLLSWLKSTLLLEIKCFDTTIYMKTQCLQTNETKHYCRNERCFRSGARKRKSSVNWKLITRDRKDALKARLPNRAENVSWYRVR